jgi:hypothetical protein
MAAIPFIITAPETYSLSDLKEDLKESKEEVLFLFLFFSSSSSSNRGPFFSGQAGNLIFD